MLADVPQQRGRPPKFVKDERGTDIVGLSPHAVKDATGEVVKSRYYATYSKPRKWFGHDRDVAISTVLSWQASQEGQSVAVPIATLSNIDDAIESEAFDQAAQTRQTFEIDEAGNVEVFTPRWAGRQKVTSRGQVSSVLVLRPHAFSQTIKSLFHFSNRLLFPLKRHFVPLKQSHCRWIVSSVLK